MCSICWFHALELDVYQHSKQKKKTSILESVWHTACSTAHSNIGIHIFVGYQEDLNLNTLICVAICHNFNQRVYLLYNISHKLLILIDSFHGIVIAKNTVALEVTLCDVSSDNTYAPIGDIHVSIVTTCCWMMFMCWYPLAIMWLWMVFRL